MLTNNKVTLAGAGIAMGLAMLVSPTLSAQAATFTYSGTTLGAPTWNRPEANGVNAPTILSTPLGTAVAYRSFGFTVSSSDNYTFSSIGSNPINWDNYTFLYKNSFNPNTPLVNAIIGNDDNPTIGLSGFTTSLSPSVNYFLVTTGWRNTDAGTFTNTITNSGLGTVSAIAATAVPEPATILGTLAAFGYGAYSRRKMKLAGSIDKKTV
jgi:hypothetical protein